MGVYLSKLDQEIYEAMFGDQDIASFACRALPFASPYPALAGSPHFEFTATLADGLKVGIHPAWQGKQVSGRTARTTPGQVRCIM